MNSARCAVVAVSLVLLSACASERAAPTPADPGQAGYAANCLTCHQADGGGVPGFQPPLVGSAWVHGDAQTLAAFVLSGGFSSAARKESASSNVMPPFSQLDDRTLAAILTYVRANFGDHAGPVGVEQVAAARALVSAAH